MTRRLNQDGFATTTLEQTVSALKQSFSLIQLGLGSIGGVALVVAGLMIGVVTSMAVLERRREIGIYRAIGARRRDISRQFLAEAMIVGFGGGVCGVGVAAGAGTGINFLLKGSASTSAHLFVLPWWLIGTGIVFAIVVSIFAAWIPASRASVLNPVDALRQA